jgi:hypothetical protein
VEGFYRSILGWISGEASYMLHCLSTEVFPWTHVLPQEGLDYNLGVIYGVPMMTLVT